jgi:septum formation protein
MLKKLILGSKSPRRKELIEGINIPFEIRTKDTDESFPSDLPCVDVAEYIAKKKADALKADIKENEIILCADTVVIVDNQILGKPENFDDAKQMLQSLSNKTHQVVTGVVITSSVKESIFKVTTDVTFKELTNEEIEFYINNYQPFDKAGSYGIQEWIGYIGVKELKGSYFNVVGLPIQEVYSVLKGEFLN